MDILNGSKIRIAVVHPRLSWGGSEAAAMWLLEALKINYDVSLITTGKVNISSLNKFYGVNLKQKELSIIIAPTLFLLFGPKKFSAVKGRLLQRYCQKLSPNFDLMISAYNPINFGKKSIQFIADFSFDEEIRQKLGLVARGWRKWYHENNFARKIYLKICDWISSVDSEYWKNDFVVANSKWTQIQLQQKYGIEAEIIYPPVIGSFPIVSHKKRENGFVCIGRITPEKRIDVMINILDEVRKKGYDIHLHIVGEMDNSRYAEKLKSMCFKNKDWIFMDGKLNEKEKKKLIINNRFGINGCLSDSFGIAVAEMVKGGCIVFVPNSGGQVEIVNHAALIYRSVEDAVNKIELVLRSSTLQKDLLKHLALQGEKFSTEKFKIKIKETINYFFSTKHNYV